MPNPREFYLSELPRLLPFAYHPKAAQIEFASNGWVRRMLGACFAGEPELLLFLRQRNGIYGPLTVPGATEKRARDIADWYQYVTVIDDLASDRSALGASADRARQLFARIVADFNEAEDAEVEIPFVMAGKNLWRRISSGLSQPQVQRFTASLDTFLRGCAMEIHAKLANEVPDYETCMSVRPDSFGCHFIELMTEYGTDVDMTDVLDELDDVQNPTSRPGAPFWRDRWAGELTCAPT